MQIYWHKRKCLHKKRIQLPQDWFGTLTWPPFHCLRHQYGRRDVMWKHSFNDPIDSTVVTQPLLIGVTLNQWHQKTYLYHSCVFTGKRKKKFLLFFPSMQCSQSWCWTKRSSPVPWVPEDTFSYWYWWFAAKPRQRGAKRQERRMTSGHRSYESHFHAILGSYYVIKTVWSWCACLFSLTLTAEMWSYMTLRLICYAWKKNCAKAYLKRKVLLKIVTNSFPKKYTLGFKYIKRREVSWEVPTLYGFRSQQDKKNFRSATLVLLY